MRNTSGIVSGTKQQPCLGIIIPDTLPGIGIGGIIIWLAVVDGEMEMKLHPQAIDYIIRHSMDDLSRKEGDLQLSLYHMQDNSEVNEMVQVITTDYIDGKTAKANGATRFCILEEFTYQDGKFGKKLQGKARLNDAKNTEGTLSLSKTNQKKCAEVAGADSKNWINKWFDFVVTNQVVEGKLQDVIYVTGLSANQGVL